MALQKLNTKKNTPAIAKLWRASKDRDMNND